MEISDFIFGNCNIYVKARACVALNLKAVGLRTENVTLYEKLETSSSNHKLFCFVVLADMRMSSNNVQPLTKRTCSDLNQIRDVM